MKIFKIEDPDEKEDPLDFEDLKRATINAYVSRSMIEEFKADIYSIRRRLDEHQNQMNDLMRVLKIMSNGLQSIDMALYDLRGKLYLAMEPIYRQLSKVIND